MSMSADDVRNITVECLPDSPYKLALYYIREQAIWWDTYHRNTGEPQAKSFCASFEALLGLSETANRIVSAQYILNTWRNARSETLAEVRKVAEEMRGDIPHKPIPGDQRTTRDIWDDRTLKEMDRRLDELEKPL